jgi:hypothetical protein
MTDEPLDEEMLRDLQRRTAQLPREIAPPEDAWARIKAQIDRESAAQPMFRQSRERAFWQRPAFLAAAALLLIAGSSIVTALVIGRRLPENSTRAVASAEQAQGEAAFPKPSNGPATLAEFTAVENEYINTANGLLEALENGRTQLSPETIAKLRESVRVIDAAILEARRALAADPANKALIQMLSTSYSQKVDLLRRTTEMWQSS